MHWANLNDFLTMGGYGLYVWGSYALLVLFLIAEIVLLKNVRSQTLKQLKRMRNWEEQ